MLELDFQKSGGLVVAIAQDYRTGEILMQAFLNQEAWEATLRTGQAVYYSRSRNKLWHKGESSGNVQIIHEIRIDCDNDSVLFLVEQVGGAACHTGHRSCFFRALNADGSVRELSEAVFNPDDVYGKKTGEK